MDKFRVNSSSLFSPRWFKRFRPLFKNEELVSFHWRCHLFIQTSTLTEKYLISLNSNCSVESRFIVLFVKWAPVLHLLILLTNHWTRILVFYSYIKIGQGVSTSSHDPEMKPNYPGYDRCHLAGFMTYTAVGHQGEINVLWFDFWRAVMLSILMNSLCYQTIWMC